MSVNIAKLALNAGLRKRGQPKVNQQYSFWRKQI